MTCPACPRLSLSAFFVFFVFFLVCAVASSPWPMIGGDPMHTFRSSYKGPSGRLNVKWSLPISPLVFGGNGPVIGANGTVYVTTNLDRNGISYLYALDGRNGNVLWKNSFSDLGSVSPAIGLDGTIYIQAGGGIYALAGDNGLVKWNTSIYIGIFNAPYISQLTLGNDGNIYVISEYHVHAIHPSTGILLWKKYVDGGGREGPTLDTFGYVYVSGFTDSLYSIYRIFGTFSWTLPGIDSSQSSPAIGTFDNRNVLYIGGRRFVYAVDRRVPRVVWTYPVGGAVAGIAQDGTVFVGLNTYELFALDGTTGQLKWQFDPKGDFITSFIIDADNKIYLGTYSSHLFIIDGFSGDLLWTYEGQHSAYSFSAIGPNATLYISSFDGYIHCLVDGPTDDDPEIPDFAVWFPVGAGSLLVLLGVLFHLHRSNERNRLWALYVLLSWGDIATDYVYLARSSYKTNLLFYLSLVFLVLPVLPGLLLIFTTKFVRILGPLGRRQPCGDAAQVDNKCGSICLALGNWIFTASRTIIYLLLIVPFVSITLVFSYISRLFSSPHLMGPLSRRLGGNSELDSQSYNTFLQYSLLYELVTESVPQLIIQVINNGSDWSPIAIVSVMFSLSFIAGRVLDRISSRKIGSEEASAIALSNTSSTSV